MVWELDSIDFIPSDLVRSLILPLPKAVTAVEVDDPDINTR